MTGRCLTTLAAALTVATACGAEPMAPAAGRFFVALNGNDAWSGALPTPNPTGTDGPFRTLARARDAVRTAGPTLDRQVVVRAGTHGLAEPLVLTPADSGTAEHPVVYQAYPGERVVLSGGRPVTGWTERGNGLWAAPVPELTAAGAVIRQFRIGDDLQTLARHPNATPETPTTGGWLFARYRDAGPAAWQTTVANIHTPGDWMEWDVEVPADGTYALWLYYGQHMKPFGRDSMDGQTVFQVDGGPDVPLTNLPNTGDWSRYAWSHCAQFALTGGRHVLRWSNRKGGGINFNAFALTTDPAWQPVTTELPATAAGAHLLVVQAEDHARAKGRELSIDRAEPPGRADQLPFGDGDIPADWDLTGGQILVFPAWGWVGGPVQIGGIDRARGLLLLTGGNAQQDIRLGNRYCLENVRAALDQPGEFYHDRAAGELLALPAKAGFRDAETAVPVLDRIVHLRGDPERDAWVEHVHLRGLAFRDTTYSTEVRSLYEPDDATVWLDQARDCVVEACTFTHLGGHAVRLLNRSTRCRILACEMSDLGQGGVIMTGKTATQATDCLVAGCRMQRLGRVYKHVAGVYVTTGSGHRVAHCTISDVPRYGISFKTYDETAYSHRNTAEYNELLRTNLETNDTGAIETLGRDRQPSGNVIRGNRILDVVGMKHKPEGGLITPFYTWGIYLDDYSSGTLIQGNIVARTVRGGYHNHLGFDNVVENNVFVDGQDYQVEWNGGAEMRRNVFRRNIVVFSNPQAVCHKASGWDPAVLAECDRNLVYWTGGDPLAAAITPAGTWAKWQELGFDRQSVVADPRFEDATHDDYRLRPDSPAWALGFERIPVERIGVSGYTRP